MSSVIQVPEQLCFLNPAPVDRLYFALLPDTAAKARAADVAEHVRRHHGLLGRPRAPHLFHVSLQGVGSYAGRPNDVVATACVAASALCAPAFRISFDRVGSFVVRQPTLPVVLSASHSFHSLNGLRSALRDTMARCGLRPRSPPNVTPHMTLLYDASRVETCAIAPVEWTVRELVLIHSLVGRSRHVHLARWQLHGSDQT